MDFSLINGFMLINVKTYFHFIKFLCGDANWKIFNSLNGCHFRTVDSAQGCHGDLSRVVLTKQIQNKKNCSETVNRNKLLSFMHFWFIPKVI